MQPRTQGASDHSHAREVEWQLACENLGSVRRWLNEHEKIADLLVQPEPTLHLLDTYFDTEDWRIYRAGFALRIRMESGRAQATLKSLHSAQDEMADRLELSEPLRSGEGGAITQSGGPVGARVHAVTGAHPLQPLFEVRTARERYAIRRQDEEQQLGEIALDETIVARPQGEARTSVQRVEVEALTSAHEPLRALVKVLRNDCSLRPATDSKYALGLKSVGLAPAPPPQFSPATVDASMRIEEVARANLRRYWSAWLAHEPGARLGDDPEALHDLRVAGRRLDATLRQFGAYLPVTLRRLSQTLKKVMRALGEARDFDVALAELEQFSSALAQGDRNSVEPLQQHLHTERAHARARMLAILDSTSVQRDFGKLTLTLTEPPSSAQPSSVQTAADVASQMIRDRYRKMRKKADRLGRLSSMEAYHEVRGRVKKLRYALDSVAALYGKPADDMLRALRRWQESLGVQHDAHVASGRLQALASAPPKGLPPETLFLMGRLAEHYAACAGKARKRFTKAYRKVRGRWKALRQKAQSMESKAPPVPASEAGPAPSSARATAGADSRPRESARPPLGERTAGGIEPPRQLAADAGA
ncbi:MAG TPA: CHAD domain-containing protein [Steroidobacteraceae bacterium]|jgi:CHAD domain-containing protein